MKNLSLICILIVSFSNLYSQKMAKDYFDKGLIDQSLVESISDFSNAIRLKPDYTEAYYYRAMAYLNNKNIDKSLEDVNVVLKMDSSKAEYFNLKGKILLKLKDGYIDALGYFTKAIEINPNFAEAYYERGIIKNGIENNIRQTKGCDDLAKAKLLGYHVLESDLVNCGK